MRACLVACRVILAVDACGFLYIHVFVWTRALAHGAAGGDAEAGAAGAAGGRGAGRGPGLQADEVVSVTTGVGRSTADFEHILDSDAADKAMPQSLWQPVKPIQPPSSSTATSSHLMPPSSHGHSHRGSVAVPGDEQYIQPQSLWQPVAVPGDEQYVHIYIHTYIPASGSRYDSLYICIYI